MRAIRFRAWDKKESKWLFGYEFPNLGGFNLIGETVLLGELGSIPLQDWNHIEVMQYTGLKDKNGKEIYEGDILDFAGIRPIEIVWEESGFIDTEERFDFTREGCAKFAAVIGNIYENPELLPAPK